MLFYNLKSWGKAVLSKFHGTTFPIELVSPCHILVILAIFLLFSFLFCMLADFSIVIIFVMVICDQ